MPSWVNWLTSGAPGHEYGGADLLEVCEVEAKPAELLTMSALRARSPQESHGQKNKKLAPSYGQV
jgi:hypothetical protein